MEPAVISVNMKRLMIYGCLPFLFWLLLLGGCKSEEIQEKAEEAADQVIFRPQQSAKETKLKSDLRLLRAAINSFMALNGRYPNSMKEIEQKGIVSKIPREAFGGVWEYDPSSGQIKSSTHPEL